MREDIDVAAERQRVEEGGADNDSLCLKNLHKAYGSKVRTEPHCAYALAPLLTSWAPHPFLTTSYSALIILNALLLLAGGRE